MWRRQCPTQRSGARRRRSVRAPNYISLFVLLLFDIFLLSLARFLAHVSCARLLSTCSRYRLPYLASCNSGGERTSRTPEEVVLEATAHRRRVDERSSRNRRKSHVPPVHGGGDCYRRRAPQPQQASACGDQRHAGSSDDCSQLDALGSRGRWHSFLATQARRADAALV